MIDLKNLNIILTGATGVIGSSILEKLHVPLGAVSVGFKANENTAILSGTDIEPPL